MKETYEDWDRHSPDRFIFDMLVRRSLVAVVDHWETILMIIASNIEREKHVEVRMDMLALMDYFLLQTELHSTIVFYSEIIMKMILVPSLGWIPGKPNVSTRKTAIVCLMKMIQNKLVEPKQLKENQPQIQKYLKSCLDDDWENDLRFASVVLIKYTLEYLKDVMEYEDFKEVYPDLLQRLDDAQDGIRLETCKAFEVFFDIIPEGWSRTLYEYIVKTIFIHLDDNNEKIQKAVIAVLMKASRTEKDTFINLAREFEGKSSNPHLCKVVLDHALGVIVMTE